MLIMSNWPEFLNDKYDRINASIPKTANTSHFTVNMPHIPIPLDQFLEKLKYSVIDEATRVSSQRMMGHMTTALPFFHRPLAKLLTTLNQNVVKIETSSTFSFLERETITQLHSLFYHSSSEQEYATMALNPESCLGVFCSGGTVANLTAMWLARNKALGRKEAFQGIATEGLFKALKSYNYEGSVIIASEMMHYSFKKAVDLLGLGESNLIRVPVDSQFRIRIDLLEIELKKAKEAKLCVIAIVGIAGTTERFVFLTRRIYPN